MRSGKCSQWRQSQCARPLLLTDTILILTARGKWCSRNDWPLTSGTEFKLLRFTYKAHSCSVLLNILQFCPKQTRFPVDSLKVPPVMLTDPYSQHDHTLCSPSPLGEHWEPPLSWTHSPLDTTILNPHSPVAWLHPTTLDCNVLVDLKTFSALSVDSLAPL